MKVLKMLSSCQKIHRFQLWFFPHCDEIFKMFAISQLNSTGCPRKIYTVRIRCIREEIQWVTKNTSSCFWNLFFSRIFPEQFELQKSYSHLFASSSEKLSDEKIIFQIQLQNQLIFAKSLFSQKKVSYWKKSAILKNSKTFFHGSKV